MPKTLSLFNLPEIGSVERISAYASPHLLCGAVVHGASKR